MIINKKSFLLASLFLPLISTLSAETKLWKINSESLTMDFTNHKATYSGNVKIKDSNIVIIGEKATAQKNNEGTFKFFDVVGTPALFKQTINKTNFSNELSANHINYVVEKNKIFAKKNVHFKKSDKDSTLDIVGDELHLNQSSGYHLKVSGKPLTLHIYQTEQLPVKVQANQLSYDEATKIIELSDNIFLSREQETIKAAKLIYNIQTGILSMPKTDDKRIEIIQAKKNKK